VFAAIHVSPESMAGGPIGKIRDGDIIRVDAEAGTLEALVPAAEWAARTCDTSVVKGVTRGMGRELFNVFRHAVSSAEEGASPFGDLDPDEDAPQLAQERTVQLAEADA
jgi:phosphogluconate dehydratase